MKALIVEDEKMAQDILVDALASCFPDIEIVGRTDSVESTLNWLRAPGNKPDLIFMDVELLDGNCFEIFRQETISAKVIMTTAYDKYAVKAFEAGCVDYLLKPFDEDELTRAVNRSKSSMETFDAKTILEAVDRIYNESKAARQTSRRRFLIRLGPKIIPVDVSDISYFYVEGKSKYIVTRSGTQYYIDMPTETFLEELDPHLFFRISRNYIVSASAIKDISRIEGGRLKVVLSTNNMEMTVSRSRVSDFLAWLM
ncbi:MAG: response regulator transcription factor [Bacteroidales bacterium]|jgi:DNA-binding LytR/AlgR family response regulator|nr:LytTR family DNA-binding domain-containing protein [Bacteroidota bacterium]NLN99819.1 response regulator transcription factor [Bacteroidales bacterium]